MPKKKITPATGPLKKHPHNPRYFTDGTGRAIYLTGSHTWGNFKDMGKTDPPPTFDFEGYLNFLQRYNHNFIRMWTWELTTFAHRDELNYAQPFPWRRTGPGRALDGKPKFNLKKFDQAYFDRLRSRVIAAGKRGIYVSIMLFEGWELYATSAPWCWDGHPFNIKNNINGIDGDLDGDGRGFQINTLEIPSVTAVQEAYVRKVVDTVNDLDNVLYEIANESGSYSTEWQYHMIRYVREYEKIKGKQHPIGMTYQFSRLPEYMGTNEDLFNSPADWISPVGKEYKNDPPVLDGKKIIISDTDHLWGIGGNQAWVWKSFCRGLNPIFMDRLHKLYRSPDRPRDIAQSDSIRRNMGYTLLYANKMNLAAMFPRNDLASTKYCLANPGVEYLIYLPEGGNVIVDLSDASGNLSVEWLNPDTGERVSGKTTSGGEDKEFTSPFSGDGDAVLYIVKH